MQTTTKLTYEDYLQLPDDGKRYELINGDLIVNPAPEPNHQWIVGNIFFEFTAHFRQHGGGRAYQSPIDVVLDAENLVEPDVVVVLDDSIVGPKNIKGAPSLVVEVLSDSTRRRDEIEKRKLYERCGVEEYWVVDPELESVKIYRGRGEGYERAAELSTEGGGTIASPLLPAFTLDVAALFRV